MAPEGSFISRKRCVEMHWELFSLAGLARWPTPPSLACLGQSCVLPRSLIITYQYLTYNLACLKLRPHILWSLQIIFMEGRCLQINRIRCFNRNKNTYNCFVMLLQKIKPDCTYSRTLTSKLITRQSHRIMTLKHRLSSSTAMLLHWQTRR